MLHAINNKDEKLIINNTTFLPNPLRTLTLLPLSNEKNIKGGGTRLAENLRNIFWRIFLERLVERLLDHGGDEGLEVPLDGVHHQGGDGRHQGVQLRGQTHNFHLSERKNCIKDVKKRWKVSECTKIKNK